MKVSKILPAIAGFVLFCSVGVPALAGTPINQNAPLLQGPPITEIISPYDAALSCMADKLTPDQKMVVYGVTFAADKTGKTNYAAPDASGTFMSQGYDDSLVTSLKKMRVRVANSGPAQRQLFDWYMGKVSAMTRGPINSNFLVPDVMVEASINCLDIDPGGAAEVTGIIEAGTRQHRLMICFNGKATVGPLSTKAYANEVLTSFAYTKQIVGYENKFGVTSFFGGGNNRSLVGFNLDKEKREPLQLSGIYMMDVVAFRVVRDITQQFGCDEVFQQAEVAANTQTLATKK